MQQSFIRMALCLVLVTTPAATLDQAAEDLLVQGHYKEAFERGIREKTAHSYQTACRAALIEGGFNQAGDEAVVYLHKALDACNASLKIAPDDLISKLSLALATGFEAKRLKSPKLAKKTKAMLETLIEEYPAHPFPYAALGGWHSEVSSAGFMARLALGARPRKARTYFQTSETYGLGDIALKFEYIKMLARGSRKGYGEALVRLNNLRSETPRTAFEKFLQERSNPLAEALGKGRRKSIINALAPLSAFHEIDESRHLPAYEFRAEQNTASTP